jgi:DNA polymerase-3 subunit epsilon
MRQIVLDTETTGLETTQGHRVIEIGCVEIIDRKLTGNRFHVYLNPERDIDAGAVEVHGLSREFLADKPRFAAIADDLLAFLRGAELIIHNAPFDLGFLNHELRRLEGGGTDLTDYCTVLDTLALARKMHPGQRNNLDALCKRYDIDNSHRDLHGALLDAEILAEVYLAMTGGQTTLALEPEPVTADEAAGKGTLLLANAALGPDSRPRIRVIRCTAEEETAHQERLTDIAKAAGGRCLWNEAS